LTGNRGDSLPEQSTTLAREGNSHLAAGAPFPSKEEPLSQPDVAAFEPGCIDRDGAYTFVKNPSADDLFHIYDMTLREIGPNVAPFSALEAVYAHNPISFWGIYRSRDESRRAARLAGFCAFLPLNAEGFDHLKNGTLDGTAPSLTWLVPRGERPCALYIWAAVGRRLRHTAGKLIAQSIGLDLYSSVPVLGKVSTEEGLHAVRNSSSPQSNTVQMGSFFETKAEPEWRAT
jgi:hypothetical protein